jgi:hypothetical protein
VTGERRVSENRHSSAIKQAFAPEVGSDFANCNFDPAFRTSAQVGFCEQSVSAAKLPARWQFYCTIGIQAPADFKVCGLGILSYLHQNGAL